MFLAPLLFAVPYQEPCAEPAAATIEIAPWMALGGGVSGKRAIGTIALDVGVTYEVDKRLRVGGWASPGTTSFSSLDVAGGARIELQSNPFNSSYSKLFSVSGRWSLIADGGVGQRFGREENHGPFWIARLLAGFTAPNLLFRRNLYPETPCSCPGETCRPPVGVIAGARPYVMVHRAFDGSRMEITGGLEFEATGAGWWLFAWI